MRQVNRRAAQLLTWLGCVLLLIAVGALPIYAQAGTQPTAPANASDLHDREHDTSPADIVILPTIAPAKPRVIVTAPAKPGATPAPTPALVLVTRMVTGMACVDANSNGQCDAGEQLVHDIIVRSQSGAFALTDALGQFALTVPVSDLLDISLPGEYRSLSGQREISIPLTAGMAVEPISLVLLPAVVAPAPTAAAPAILPPIKVELPQDFARPIVNVNVDLKPLYLALGALAGVLLLSQLLISGVLRGMRRSYDRTFKSQEMLLVDQRKQDLAMRLQAPDGWHRMAEQLAADALAEPVSIDEEAGILDACSQPAPKFTLASRDGREFIFTVDPDLLKKQRLIDRRDKVLKLSKASATGTTDAAMLWEYVMASRRLWRVTPPRQSEWYLVIRPGRAPAGYQLAAPARKQLAAHR